jgi:riboflavin kinase/FMN adenylyltransferase
VELIRNLQELPPRLHGGAVSIGNFDGVHRGHRQIVERLRAAAARRGGPSVVFTFEPHPVRLLRPEQAPPPLTWTERKADLLAELGVDAMIAFPTDMQLLQLTAERFFAQIVVEQLRASAMVEGPNFFFGKNRAGNVQRLEQLCQQNAVELEIVEPIQQGEAFVSSSRIRRALADGEATAAAEMLGKPYRIRGLVTHGAGRGRGLGFPTANLDAVDTLIPGRAVYAAQVRVGQQAYAAAVHVGPNPTFGEAADKVEVHLIGFSGSLYGSVLEVDFLAKLRTIRTFEGVEQLRDQLQRDIRDARNWQ